MLCLRCEGVEVEPAHPGFVRCPQCARHFRITSEGSLVEAWLGPISLVLYPVIFEEKPQEDAERVANELHAASQPGRRSIFRRVTRKELEGLLAEIQLELEHPTQSVREILLLSQAEADLRQYLRLVAKRLGELLRE